MCPREDTSNTNIVDKDAFEKIPRRRRRQQQQQQQNHQSIPLSDNNNNNSTTMYDKDYTSMKQQNNNSDNSNRTNNPLFVYSSNAKNNDCVMRKQQRRRRLLVVVLVLFAMMMMMMFWLYGGSSTSTSSSYSGCWYGVVRSIQFWKGALPLVLEYKWMQCKAYYVDGLRVEMEGRSVEYVQRVSGYHQKTAPKVVKLIQELGGIYIKVGQVISTMGSGIVDEHYITSLRPLQDGVTPRNYNDIATILQQSTGKQMSQLFHYFETTPIGSASIAQVHRATLIDGQEVVVKVQYPEVAKQLHADLNNLELLVKWVMAENKELMQSIRKRHESELDFTMEAQNLIQVKQNMQRHGLDPKFIHIPRVVNDTGICNQYVLAMEYLQGIPLSQVIQQEQTKWAQALSSLEGQQQPQQQPNADQQQFQSILHQRLRKHFDNGGGEDNTLLINNNNNNNNKLLKLMEMIGPSWTASAFRFYVNMKQRLNDVFQWKKKKKKRRDEDEDYQYYNLKHIVKTLVKVHGIQLMVDGVYNADPHPGNVLILPDGRLGLLDYGMVGHLTKQQRQTIAHVVKALFQNDKSKVAQLYQQGGYQIKFRRNKFPNIPPNDIHILHRLATFHFNTIDFSKLIIPTTTTSTSKNNGPTTTTTSTTIDIISFLHAIQELNIPDWIEQGRRLTGLLIGISVQTARPISIAKEWEPIATQTLRLLESK